MATHSKQLPRTRQLFYYLYSFLLILVLLRHFLHDTFECCGLILCELREHFAVDFDIFSFEHVHELAVDKAVCA